MTESWEEGRKKHIEKVKSDLYAGYKEALTKEGTKKVTAFQNKSIKVIVTVKNNEPLRCRLGWHDWESFEGGRQKCKRCGVGRVSIMIPLNECPEKARAVIQAAREMEA